MTLCIGSRSYWWIVLDVHMYKYFLYYNNVEQDFMIDNTTTMNINSVTIILFMI